MMTTTAPFDELTGAWTATGVGDPEALAEWQLAMAWRVVEAAVRNAYHAPRLEALPARRDRAAFELLPRMTKRDVVDDCAAAPPFGTRGAIDRSEVRGIVETSGTSGLGKAVFPLNGPDLELVHQTEAVGFWWAGVRPGSTVLLTLPVGVTAAGQWYAGGLQLLGANVLSVGAYPTDRKVEVLARYGADLVVGTPSYVQRLARVCCDQGVDPAGLGVSSLMIAGERYSRRWVEEMQALWGAAVYEQYGCTERAIAWTCPGGVLRDGSEATLHFPAEGALCEVVDPETGSSVAHGETGELVVTPFSASASPLIRYRTGDRVELVAGGRCHCGRPNAGIRPARVERFDNMLKIRGVNVWPEALDAVIFAVDGVVDYRGAVRTSDDGGEVVVVEVEASSAAGARVSQSIVDDVRRHLGIGVRVGVLEIGELSRRVPEGFVKVARWSDERATRHAEEGREG